jgi:thioredoxin reductase (NADPH)
VEITATTVLLERVGGERSTVPADHVLLLTGYVPDPTLFLRAGVDLEPGTRAPRFDPRTMETNVPGLFVAGTATAGEQKKFEVFIETSHVHADRIVAAITGAPPPEDSSTYRRPES